METAEQDGLMGASIISRAPVPGRLRDIPAAKLHAARIECDLGISLSAVWGLLIMTMVSDPSDRMRCAE
ncbi:MAG: hypothetical protein LBT71_00635 [Azoarcus sp.]|jgi:hypothetical protein|nr:hypothetical protein [Azoarcus sp.]